MNAISTRLAAALLCAALACVAAQDVADTCLNPVSECDADTDYFPDKFSIDDATETITAVDFQNTYVDISSTVGTVEYSYRLVRCGCEGVAPAADEGVQTFSVPPKDVYVDDTVIQAMLSTEIAATDRIFAVRDPTFAYNQQIKRLVTSGAVKSISEFSELSEFDAELDLNIIGSFNIPTYLESDLATPYIVSGERSEVSPIARAEWIKVFGLIFDQVPQATRTFDDIKFRYSAISEKAFSVRRRPSVVVNVPFADFETGELEWVQPGGEEYTTQFLRDANVDYRYANDGKDLGTPLTLKEVETDFGSARYWINVFRFPSVSDETMDTFLSAEENEATADTFKKLAAVKCGNVWSQTKRITEDGNGNDFFELGVIRPDLILADMLQIFHPNVADDEEMTFYYSLGSADEVEVDACPYNELPLEAEGGKTFVTSEYMVKGADRFAIEDKLASDVSPAVAEAIGVPETDTEIFFDRDLEDTDDDRAFVKVRAQMDKGDADDFDSDAVATAIGDSMGDGVTASVEGDTTTEVDTRSSSSDDGLSGGAIAGIVIGSLAALALVAAATFFLASKRSRAAAYQELKDKYWTEHRVRLAEDTTDSPAQNTSPAQNYGDEISPNTNV